MLHTTSSAAVFAQMVCFLKNFHSACQEFSLLVVERLRNVCFGSYHIFSVTVPIQFGLACFSLHRREGIIDFSVFYSAGSQKCPPDSDSEF